MKAVVITGCLILITKGNTTWKINFGELKTLELNKYNSFNLKDTKLSVDKDKEYNALLEVWKNCLKLKEVLNPKKPNSLFGSLFTYDK